MHDKEKFIENSVKKLEKRNLTEEQQQELDAFIVLFNFFKNTRLSLDRRRGSSARRTGSHRHSHGQRQFRHLISKMAT